MSVNIGGLRFAYTKLSLNSYKVRNGILADVKECVRNLSLEEERAWKRILGNTFIVILQNNEKSPKVKARVFTDEKTVKRHLVYYLFLSINRQGSVKGFLELLRERGR